MSSHHEFVESIQYKKYVGVSIRRRDIQEEKDCETVEPRPLGPLAAGSLALDDNEQPVPETLPPPAPRLPVL